jgi:biopolymer transport protein TolR
MNAAQVRAKARMAMKRREEEIETDEREGGELNLVPYLDIITNIVLFLLASVTTGLVLGTVNSSLPEFSAGAAAAVESAANPGDEPPLQLVAAVTKKEIQVFSLSGLEGTVTAPKLRLPAQNGTYPYGKITDAAQEIVKRRWAGKPPMSVVSGKPECLIENKVVAPEQCRPDKATEVFLIVDGDVRYEVVIATMDALREAPDGTPLFPGVIFSSGIQ